MTNLLNPVLQDNSQYNLNTILKYIHVKHKCVYILYIIYETYVYSKYISVF